MSYLKVTWNRIKNLSKELFEPIFTIIKNVFTSVRNTTMSIWNGIKSFLTSAFNAIRSVTSSVFGAVGSIVSSIWNGIRSTISSVVNAVKSVVSSVWNGIRSTTSSVFGSIAGIASRTWGKIRDAMTKPVEAARDKIKSAIDRIKGFFSGLKLKLPKIEMPKLPKFKMEGKFSFKPPSVPKLGVSWNAKGGVFNKPTIFNTSNAGLQGVGEAGSEAIIPLKPDVLAGIGKGIAEQMNQNEMINLLAQQKQTFDADIG